MDALDCPRFCIQLKKRELEVFAFVLPLVCQCFPGASKEERTDERTEHLVLHPGHAAGFKDNKQEAAARFLLSAINDQD